MIIGWTLALGAGLLAGGLRHAVGATPILAALLCASCVFRGRDVAVIGVVGMLIDDLVAGLSWFMLVHLVGILSVVGIIAAVRVRPTVRSLLAGLVLSAPVYHLVLALGDWVTHTCSKEPWTPSGLANTLASSLPYFQRSLIGDLLLTSAFLSLYTLAGYLVTWRWPTLLPQPSKG